MYAVVGCTDCGSLWLLSEPDASETARCPNCGRRHRTKRLKRLFESADHDAARQARAALLAEKQGASEAFERLDSVAEMEPRADVPVVDDRTFLEASGLDADRVATAGEDETASRNRLAVIRDAVGTQNRPTEDAVVDYAVDHGVPAEAARDLLAKLVRRGDVSESRGRYRLL